MEVQFERHGAVAVIVLSNPEVRNGLNPELARQIQLHCDDIDADASIGAAVVRGDRGTFCSGADTRQLSGSWHDANEFYEWTNMVYQAFVRVGALSVPVVAAVRGAAVGAGLNLMMAADLRVVATDARLIGGFTRIGLHPGGGFFTLLNRGSREAASALGLFGQEISGERAAELGMAWCAVSDGEVEPLALEIATQAAHAPELARSIVRTFRSELGPPQIPWPVALEMERAQQLRSALRQDDH